MTINTDSNGFVWPSGERPKIGATPARPLVEESTPISLTESSVISAAARRQGPSKEELAERQRNSGPTDAELAAAQRQGSGVSAKQPPVNAPAFMAQLEEPLLFSQSADTPHPVLYWMQVAEH